MGFVYKARDKRMMNKFVVIKVPRAEMVVDSQFRKRFVQELQSLVALDHRHIVAIQDYNQEDKIPYAVMQYLPGGDLEDRRSQDPQDLKNWLMDISKALDFVHEKGYVHRDVKPGNILFDDQGYAYLSDFGIAKVVAESEDNQQGITSMGFAVGTPQYMAPELAKKKFDGRIDQYALAVTLYEILSGSYPFEGDTNQETILMHHSQEMPVIKTIPGDLNRVIRKGMAKKPEDRYQNCKSFATDVLKFVDIAAEQFKQQAAAKSPKRSATMVEPVGSLAGGGGTDAGGRDPGPGTIFEPLPKDDPDKNDKNTAGGDTEEVKSDKSDTKKTLINKDSTAQKAPSESNDLSHRRKILIGCVVGFVAFSALIITFVGTGSGVNEGIELLAGEWHWDYDRMLNDAGPRLASEIRSWEQRGIQNIIVFGKDGVVVERQENALIPTETRSRYEVQKLGESYVKLEVASPLSDRVEVWRIDDFQTYDTLCVLVKGDNVKIYLEKKRAEQ